MSSKIELNDEDLENVVGGAFLTKGNDDGSFKVKGLYTGQIFTISTYKKYQQFRALLAANPDTLEGEKAIIAACKSGNIFD